MDEKKLIFICLFTSLIGLFLIYMAAINLKPQEIEISEINSNSIGKTVKVNGVIVYKRISKDGHIFLTISDNKTKIQVPLFYNFLKGLSEYLDVKELKVGSKISVTGLVDEYMGNFQVIPRKPTDVQLVK